MKKIFYLSTMFAVFFLIACEKITDPIDETGKITAKEYVDDVLQKARLDFATDAKLSAIYGWNVDLLGKIDLLETDNAFVYVVQSNNLQSNEFYVPVFAAGPVKSPINFSTMFHLLKTLPQEIFLEVFLADFQHLRLILTQIIKIVLQQ
jgi:hypothetical protein